MRKKHVISVVLIITIILFGLITFALCFRDGLILDWLGIHVELPLGKKIEIVMINDNVDNNKNRIADPIDIVNAARQEVKNRTSYKSAYYNGGPIPAEVKLTSIKVPVDSHFILKFSEQIYK